MSSSGLRKRVTKTGQDAPESTNRQEFTANLIDSVDGVANRTSNQNAGVASGTSNQNSGVANGTSNQNSGTAYWTWNENSWVADLTSSQMSGVAKNQRFADSTWNQYSGVASGTSSQNSGVTNCTWNQNSQVVTRTFKQNSAVASGTLNQISGVADGTSNQNSRVANGTSNQNSGPDQIILKSCDGVEFKVPLAVAEQSGMVKAVMADGFSNFVPLPTVSAPVVALMISFWTEHSEGEEFTREHEKELKDQEKKKFFDEMDRELLFDFVLAANYMDAKEMLDSTCQYIADTIKNLPIEDVRNYFGIVDEFMPEEEQCVIEENKWAYE